MCIHEIMLTACYFIALEDVEKVIKETGLRCSQTAEGISKKKTPGFLLTTSVNKTCLSIPL